MKTVLIKGTACYADEFDCEFFAVMKENKWDELCKGVKDAFELIDDEVEFYFGTNESLVFSSYEDWFDTFEVKELTPEEYKTITKFFGENYGTGVGALEYILEVLNDRIEADEEVDDDSAD